MYTYTLYGQGYTNMVPATAIALLAAANPGLSTEAPPLHRPPFSWNTLPVFFHSSNTSGPWSPAAVKAIAKFAMATNEKSHGMLLPDGSRQSEELAGPAACRQIAKEGTGTATFFYLNSVIDWPFNFKLHEQMVANPSWREQNVTGGDIRGPGNNYLYELGNPDTQAAWIDTCVNAVEAGCSGCFIDQANLNEEGTARAGGATKDNAAKFSAGHLSTLVALSKKLSTTGNYPILNHFGVTGPRAQGMFRPVAMMIEDFAGTETCVTKLQTISSRGFTVQAHAGDLPKGQAWGGQGKGNQCVNGDTNSMAAFLIGAGEYSYYHCSFENGKGGTIWGSASAWPSVPDSWLDWIPEYDYSLGEPTGPATSEPSTSNVTGLLPNNAHIWKRSFKSGTVVEFDGGSGQGTIRWAKGPTQVGLPYTNVSVARLVAAAGCKWEDV